MSDIEVKCDCPDWAELNKAISSLVTLAFIHGMKYNGPFFRYCPMCGKPLPPRQEGR